MSLFDRARCATHSVQRYRSSVPFQVIEIKLEMEFAAVVDNPWFWASLALIGWLMGIGLVGIRSLGRRQGFGIVMLILAEVPRIILPLGFVTQPRIDPAPIWLMALGGFILGVSLVFGSPVLRIKPLTGPDSSEPLRTNGLYGIVRHPLMVCDMFWPLGLSMICGSIIGAALTPLWCLLIWVLTLVEERSLVKEYGDAYRKYQETVPRFLPRL